MESLLGTFSVPGPGLCSGEAAETKRDKAPDLRMLGEDTAGKRLAARGSSDSDKVGEVSALGLQQTGTATLARQHVRPKTDSERGQEQPSHVLAEVIRTNQSHKSMQIQSPAAASHGSAGFCCSLGPNSRMPTT